MDAGGCKKDGTVVTDVEVSYESGVSCRCSWPVIAICSVAALLFGSTYRPPLVSKSSARVTPGVAKSFTPGNANETVQSFSQKRWELTLRRPLLMTPEYYQKLAIETEKFVELTDIMELRFICRIHLSEDVENWDYDRWPIFCDGTPFGWPGDGAKLRKWTLWNQPLEKPGLSGGWAEWLSYVVARMYGFSYMVPETTRVKFQESDLQLSAQRVSCNVSSLQPITKASKAQQGDFLAFEVLRRNGDVHFPFDLWKNDNSFCGETGLPVAFDGDNCWKRGSNLNETTSIGRTHCDEERSNFVNGKLPNLCDKSNPGQSRRFNNIPTRKIFSYWWDCSYMTPTVKLSILEVARTYSSQELFDMVGIELQRAVLDIFGTLTLGPLRIAQFYQGLDDTIATLVDVIEKCEQMK